MTQPLLFENGEIPESRSNVFIAGSGRDRAATAAAGAGLAQGSHSSSVFARSSSTRHEADAVEVRPAPYVRNGPEDQIAFHNFLIGMQIRADEAPIDVWARRLSLVEEVDGFGPTAQQLLERSKTDALAWNSNYGPHGWHRYVGRFPPHLVRALLNSFGADANSVVCDPFTGSGTTAVECRLLGVPFKGIEICPLSCLIARTKATFPVDASSLAETAEGLAKFFQERSDAFLQGRLITELTHEEVIERPGDRIGRFPNFEKWFTPQAFLGASIVVEYGLSLRGYERDAALLALSSRMRSIGNVDVDVVRAEYSRKPREGVDVCRLVVNQLRKMRVDVQASLKSHAGLMGTRDSIEIVEGSVLDVDFPESSICHVITSPPYGVEAISYLRTHLLSYRALIDFLKHDPYATRDKTIGSEYLDMDTRHDASDACVVSGRCSSFFQGVVVDGKGGATRRTAMLYFFDDMFAVAQRLSRWVKGRGMVAFVIGNKKLGDVVVPADEIIRELFEACGFEFVREIRHKLKTNNSNSRVPWQDRIIQDEAVLVFRRLPKQ